MGDHRSNVDYWAEKDAADAAAARRRLYTWSGILLACLLGMFSCTYAFADEADNGNAKPIVKVAPTIEGAFEQSFKACLNLSCNNGHGSAFYIGHDYFLTAAHVAQGNKSFVLKRKDGRIINAVSVWIDQRADWALLAADKPVTGIAPVKLTCAEPTVDDAIYTIGNPADFTFIKTRGVVAGKQEYIGGSSAANAMWVEAFVTDLTVFGGNSGGAVFNAKGEVWGNLVGVLRGTSLSVVEPLSKVCAILPREIVLAESN